MLTPENTFNRDEVRGKMRFFAGAPQRILFFLPRTAKAPQHVKRTHARTTPMTKTAAMVAQFFAGSDRSEDTLGGGHFSSGPAAREDGASPAARANLRTYADGTGTVDGCVSACEGV